MSQLKIIRASAGSGKTHYLTGEYLKLLIKEYPQYFKHILAVTFTNKATAEMKERILKELHAIADSQESPYMDSILADGKLSKKDIRNKAKVILNNILHGYSWFRIETIDSFFQRVIRVFTRELGIPGFYNIELDTMGTLQLAIDRVLDKLNEEDKLLSWLVDSIESRIEAGKSWDIRDELQRLGRELFNESYLSASLQLQEKVSDPKWLGDYRKLLEGIVQAFENKLKQFGVLALSHINEHELDPQDFYYAKRGVMGFFNFLVLGAFSATQLAKHPNSYVKKCLDDPSVWGASKSKNKAEVNALAASKLHPLLNETFNYIEAQKESYFAAKSLLRNLHALGVLNHLAAEIREIKEEKNIFLISDGAPFLHQIIDNNEAPFIYEKVGNQFQHFMIDEFQDTSQMQWDNFRPLLENSLSNNNSCLVVGDVKQAIYRWRNSNWEILANKVQRQFAPSMLAEINLDTNWRSLGNIIAFNNEFIKELARICQQQIEPAVPILGSDYIPLEGIYADAEQKIPPHKEEEQGYIRLKLYEAKQLEDKESYYHEDLVGQINALLAKGYQPGDMAVLVRNKKEGRLLANFIIQSNLSNLFDAQIGVISNESLYLEGSLAVRLLLAALRFIQNPKDDINASTLLAEYLTLTAADEGRIEFPAVEFESGLLDQYIGTSFNQTCQALKPRPLYETAEALIPLLGLNKLKEETIFLHAFLDVVHEFVGKQNASLSAFLEFWKENGGDKSVSVAETKDSIRILTIHKSKGLQFPIVLLPFCDWSNVPHTNSILWSSPQDEPFNDLPIAAVNYGKDLEASNMSKDYYLEQYRSLIDNLNLLYVAFTRAEDCLLAYAKTGSRMGEVGDLMAKTVQSMTLRDGSKFHGAFDAEEGLFEYGERPSSASQKKKGLTLEPYTEIQNLEPPQVNISPRLRELLGSTAFEAAQHGKVWHAILEKVSHREDISKAILKAELEGLISHEDGEKIHGELKLAFEEPKVQEWFSGQYQVLNESDIVLPNGQVRRPDRVMIKDKKVVVVDYKFGSDENLGKHQKQVLGYMNLIGQMGFQDVEGYVWYVQNHQIDEVRRIEG